MREKATWLLALLGALVMIYNLHVIFTGLPDDALQGMIFRIIFIHVPADLVADIFYTVALVTSIMFLAKKNFLYDSITVSCIEVATMLILVNLVTGSVWGRNQWGVWWTWDLRLTTQLMKFVLYLGYLIIRPAISEPTQRATMSSIVSHLRLRGRADGLDGDPAAQRAYQSSEPGARQRQDGRGL